MDRIYLPRTVILSEAKNPKVAMGSFGPHAEVSRPQDDNRLPHDDNQSTFVKFGVAAAAAAFLGILKGGVDSLRPLTVDLSRPVMPLADEAVNLVRLIFSGRPLGEKEAEDLLRNSMKEYTRAMHSPRDQTKIAYNIEAAIHSLVALKMDPLLIISEFRVQDPAHLTAAAILNEINRYARDRSTIIFGESDQLRTTDILEAKMIDALAATQRAESTGLGDATKALLWWARSMKVHLVKYLSGATGTMLDRHGWLKLFWDEIMPEMSPAATSLIREALDLRTAVVHELSIRGAVLPAGPESGIPSSSFAQARWVAEQFCEKLPPDMRVEIRHAMENIMIGGAEEFVNKMNLRAYELDWANRQIIDRAVRGY